MTKPTDEALKVIEYVENEVALSCKLGRSHTYMRNNELMFLCGVIRESLTPHGERGETYRDPEQPDWFNDLSEDAKQKFCEKYRPSAPSGEPREVDKLNRKAEAAEMLASALEDCLNHVDGDTGASEDARAALQVYLEIKDKT